MKKMVLTVLLGVAISTVATAKGGGGRKGGSGGGNNDVLQRGTAAWFVVESAEHEVRGLANDKQIDEDALTHASVELTSTTESKVHLESGSDTVDDDCDMYDHSSKSGTVIKKDVRCDGIRYYSDKYDLKRGSSAWAVIEGLEHSFRLAVISDKTVLDNAIKGTSNLMNGNAVDVVLTMKDGTELVYACSYSSGGYYGGSVNCAKSK